MAERRYASNKKKLARECGIAHTTLLRMWKFPDAPKYVAGKGWLIDQCQRYVEAKKQYSRDTSAYNGRSNPNLRDAAYVKRQEIEAQKAEFDLDVKRSKYELKSAMTERVLTNWNFFIRELDKMLKHELPPRLEGLSAGAISKLLGSKLDRLRERAASAIESRNGTEPRLA